MEEVIRKFYEAFEKQDAETMVSFYHDDVIFSDPGFGTLKGERAKNMWRMLCESATDLRVESSNIKADESNGEAHWEAWYSFSQTGRKVHNIIDARFQFKDGKIIEHHDTFNLHRWAKQALGFKGALLGGTSFFKKKLHQQTGRMLDKFEKKQG